MATVYPAWVAYSLYQEGSGLAQRAIWNGEYAGFNGSKTTGYHTKLYASKKGSASQAVPCASAPTGCFYQWKCILEHHS